MDSQQPLAADDIHEYPSDLGQQPLAADDIHEDPSDMGRQQLLAVDDLREAPSGMGRQHTLAVDDIREDPSDMGSQQPLAVDDIQESSSSSILQRLFSSLSDQQKEEEETTVIKSSPEQQQRPYPCSSLSRWFHCHGNSNVIMGMVSWLVGWLCRVPFATMGCVANTTHEGIHTGVTCNNLEEHHVNFERFTPVYQWFHCQDRKIGRNFSPV